MLLGLLWPKVNKNVYRKSSCSELFTVEYDRYGRNMYLKFVGKFLNDYKTKC